MWNMRLFHQSKVQFKQTHADSRGQPNTGISSLTGLTNFLDKMIKKVAYLTLLNHIWRCTIYKTKIKTLFQFFYAIILNIDVFIIQGYELVWISSIEFAYSTFNPDILLWITLILGRAENLWQVQLHYYTPRLHEETHEKAASVQLVH